MTLELDFTQVAVVLVLVLWLGYALGAGRWKRRLEDVEAEWAAAGDAIRDALPEGK